MKHFTLSLLLIITIISASLITISCTDKDVKSAFADVVSGAHSLVLAVQTVAPNDPRLPRLNTFLATVDKFQTDLAAAITPDAEVQLLPALTAIIDVFEADVVPLLGLSVNVGIAVALIDAGLHIVANHFHGTVASASKKFGGARTVFGVNVGNESSKLSKFMAMPRIQKPKQ